MDDKHASQAHTFVPVWDLAVRTFHWSLVAAFFVSYFTEEELLDLHVWAGYIVGGLIVFRVIWGFVGSEHARFRDFLFPPATILGYLRDVAKGRSRRYLGHSPGGSLMVFTLLALCAGVVISGVMLYGADQKAGPLAPFFATAGEPAAPASQKAVEVENESEETKESGKNGEAGEANGGGEASEDESPFVEALEEVHEFLANFTVALVIIHVIAVVLMGFVHRENLVFAMFTGRKRREP